MLTFHLKKEWYDKIRSGEKTVEYREVKPYWTLRLYRTDILPHSSGSSAFASPNGESDCILRLGYTKFYCTAAIKKIEIVDGKNTDLAIDAPVYAIHLANITEHIPCERCGGTGIVHGGGIEVTECPVCKGRKMKEQSEVKQ